MSITAVSSNQNLYQTGSPVNAKQIKSDYQNLTTAIQAGDMASAQQALAALQKDDPKVAAALSSSNANSSNPQVAALQSLATALQSNDPTAAQTALVSLQQTMKGHRAHHHHAQPASAAPAPSAADGAASETDNDGDNSGSGATRATFLNAIA